MAIIFKRLLISIPGHSIKDRFFFNVNLQYVFLRETFWNHGEFWDLQINTSLDKKRHVWFIFASVVCPYCEGVNTSVAYIRDSFTWAVVKNAKEAQMYSQIYLNI